jgi:hypothetical protein
LNTGLHADQSVSRERSTAQAQASFPWARDPKAGTGGYEVMKVSKGLGLGGLAIATWAGSAYVPLIAAVFALAAFVVFLLLASHVVAMFAPHRSHVLGVLDRLVALVAAIRGGPPQDRGT